MAYSIDAFTRNPKLSNAYVAVGTLALAIATGFLAYFTYLSVKGIHDRERHDKKVKLISEIRDWANSGLQFMTRMTHLSTTHDRFPKVYEAIAFLTYSKGFRFLISDSLNLSVNNVKLTKSLENAFQELDDCLAAFQGKGKNSDMSY